MQWDHARPPPGGYLSDDEIRARLDAKRAQRQEQRGARAASFDEGRAVARIQLLRAHATAGFMRHVLSAPADSAQAAKAVELLAGCERQAAALSDQVGDPDTVVDRHGDLPAARRERHLIEHMTYFRHPVLREWSSGQRQRFDRLLAMPPPSASQMCSECQAPADWHTYGLSLRLWSRSPPPDSAAAKLAHMMPGWWDRCPACTDYQLRHRWGVDVLPGFGPEQWHTMLTPLLRAVFNPDKPVPRQSVDRRAALTRRLHATEAETERLRRQLAALEPIDDNIPDH